MKPSTALLAVYAAAVSAVDMKPYKPAPNVDAAFAKFVEEYYRTSEDKTATTAFTNFWPPDGELVVADIRVTGSRDILGIKQALLPLDQDKTWHHLIRGATVAGDTKESKTFVANIVIQTTYALDGCSQAYGNASFTILKDAEGVPRLTPHSESLSSYKLAVSTVESPTNIPCSSS
ncbi:hypothetical protein C8035_v004213 [Colletotrichum spinosum]|uniref:SnoaL-like domain-containing protein n=1 Tax=Colletotrichum spinosum TaxID=1347390 RepID=A0A4V3HR02_9PEZI|nr:hypothetical protein C8035_v004213 [Colletotrichum spinosum]